MKTRKIDRVLLWFFGFGFVIAMFLYCLASVSAERYQRYYNSVVKSLETHRGTSTPDFTILSNEKGKSMEITLNKNMKSSLDVKKGEGE